MAAYYVREIRNLQSHGPYYLGGYCFGGNVAYEMARQLKSKGEEIGLLILLDSAPSNAGYEKMKWWDAKFPYRFLRNLYYWGIDFRNLSLEQQRGFVARKARAMARKVLRKVHGKNGASELVDLEVVIDLNHLPEQEHRLWEIHLRALAQHVQQEYDGPVMLFRTRGQAMFCSLDDDLSWGRLVKGRVTVKGIPGSHENIFMEPNVQYLARELSKCLEQNQETKT
jgi:thioesterase domain-containing protein